MTWSEIDFITYNIIGVHGSRDESGRRKRCKRCACIIYSLSEGNWQWVKCTYIIYNNKWYEAFHFKYTYKKHDRINRNIDSSDFIRFVSNNHRFSPNLVAGSLDPLSVSARARGAEDRCVIAPTLIKPF